MSKCKDCTHCSKGEIDKQTLKSTLVCALLPPVTLAVLTPNGSALMSSQPVTQPEWGCSHFKQKVIIQ